MIAKEEKMRSNWIKFTAIIMGVCYGIYTIYLMIVVFKVFKQSKETIAISIVTFVLTYVIVLMFIGAIYRIGTLTDQVSYLSGKITDLEIKYKKESKSMKEQIDELGDTCPQCGHKLDGDEVYCQSCGFKL